MHLKKLPFMDEKAGADLIHIETMSDTYEVKCGNTGCKREYITTCICNDDL